MPYRTGRVGSRKGLVALLATRVSSRAIGLDKPPVIAALLEVEPQYPELYFYQVLAVGALHPAGPCGLTAGPHHELVNPLRQINVAVRVLGLEDLVIVIVAVENYVCAIAIQDVPRRPHLRVRAVVARTVERVVPVGQDAAGVRLCEVLV